MKRTVAALVLVVGLIACGSAERSPSGAAPDDPVANTPRSASPAPHGGPRVVEPEGGLENVLPTAWSDARILDGGRAARLTWYSGVEECYGLDHVDVDYGDKKVTVTLFAGARASKKPCIELAEEVVTTVHLDEPLGDRDLVDGA
jgi:hypothetical protein